jgi:putative spermidine/putrescine transport system ATP-binding protein
MVMVTHNQDEAMALADRIVVLNKGRVEQEGSPEDIYESPKSAFVASFVGRKNVLEGVVEHPCAGNHVVATELGALRADRDFGVKCEVGSRVVYVIDSGRIFSGSAANNVINGEVLSAQRLGVMEVVRVRVGSVILAWQRLAGSAPVVVEGSPVTLSWSSTDALVLPSDRVA